MLTRGIHAAWGASVQIAELGQMLLNFASVIPAGMVVFVPSYSFLDLVKSAWEKSGLIDKLQAKKKVCSADRSMELDTKRMPQVFSEPQEASQVETVLREYAAAIRDPVRLYIRDLRNHSLHLT